MKRNFIKVAAIVMVATLAGLLSYCKKSSTAETTTAAESNVKAEAGLKVQSASYSIPVGTITDHSDPTITGSIAWYLAQYGGGTSATNYNTFYLSSSAVYNCKKTITMPAYARITESSGVTAVMQCDPTNWSTAAGNDKFIRMNESCIILHVELRLNWMPQIGVFINTANNVQLIDVTIHKSKKVDNSYLVYATESSYLTIDNCLMRRAGVDTETNFMKHGYPIHIIRGSNISITNNDIGVASSSGIGFVQSTHVVIDNNQINDTGRALIAEYISDGITSYHGAQGSLNRDIHITNNTITNSRNHGIHVSGYGISIEGNSISSSTQSNIYLGDQRTPQDCTADVWVNNNTLGSAGATYSIYRNSVIASRIHIGTNTGDTSLQPAIAGSCPP